MSRRPDWIPPRAAIPQAAQREVLRRSGGMCEAEGCDNAGKEVDHDKAVALGGTNDPSNLRLLCRKHHAEKTKADMKAIAKADRQGARSGQQARRKAGKTAKIKSPGFRQWRKFDGTIVTKGIPND